MSCRDQDWIEPISSSESDEDIPHSISGKPKIRYTYGQAVQNHTSKKCHWVREESDVNVVYLKLSCHRDCGKFDDSEYEETHYSRRCNWLQKLRRNNFKYDNYLVRHCRCTKPKN